MAEEQRIQAGNPSRRRLLGLAAGGGAAAASAWLVGCSTGGHGGQPGRVAASGSTPTPDPDEAIVGAWHGFSLRQGESTRYVGLTVFHGDGSYTSQGADPTRGPGIGAWKPAGNGRYALTWVSLLFASDGTYQGIQKIRAVLGLNAAHDQLTMQSGSRVDWYDTEGKLYRTTVPGGAVYARIAVEDQGAPSQPTFPVNPEA